MNLKKELEAMVGNQPESLLYEDYVIDYIPGDTSSYTEMMSSDEGFGDDYRFVLSYLEDETTGDTQYINSFDDNEIEKLVRTILTI